MKTTTLTKGALTLLAAVTAATTLGAGLPASAAPAAEPTAAEPSTSAFAPTDETAADPQTGRQTGRFIWKYGNNKYEGYNYLALGTTYFGMNDPATKYQQYYTLEQAVANSSVFEYPALGTSGPIINKDTGLCLTPKKVTIVEGTIPRTMTVAAQDACDTLGQSARTWKRASDGAFLSETGRNLYLSTFENHWTGTPASHYVALAIAGYSYLTDSARVTEDGKPYPGDEVVAPLTAQVDSVDNDKRSALISGTGEPGSIVSIAGQPDLTIPASGAWTTTVGGLAIGDNTITIENRIKGNLASTITLTATVEKVIEELFEITSPKVEDGYVSGKPTTFSGKGNPGATVKVTNKFGTSLGADVTVDAQGAWSFTRVMTGKSVYQMVFTETSLTGKTQVVNFFNFKPQPEAAPAFVVTSPKVEDGYVSGKPTTFTGKANPGSTISVTNKFGTSLGNDFRADDQGNWTFTRVLTGTSTYHIVFTETTISGKTNTVNFFNFKPKAPVAPTFQVTSPKTTDGYTPNTNTTFTGTAHPGATISITNKWGVSLGADVTADQKGAWSITRKMTGTSTYQIHFVETHNGTQTTVEFYGFAPKK